MKYASKTSKNRKPTPTIEMPKPKPPEKPTRITAGKSKAWQPRKK